MDSAADVVIGVGTIYTKTECDVCSTTSSLAVGETVVGCSADGPGTL
jgi:hypothetical protein